jgi:hypothetical protein
MDTEVGDWLAVDGKSIKGTLEQAHSSYQNFVNLRSIYTQRQGVVVALRQFENAAESEINVVEAMLLQLQLTGVVFSFDALHAPKKTLALIVEQGNDYLVGVKGNQPKLMQAIEPVSQQQSPSSGDCQRERSRDRDVERIVSVYDDVSGPDFSC